jgi:hypothetical protein
VLANPIKEHTVFDHAADPSSISTVADGDLFESITGRKLRASSRFRNADAKSLHEGQRVQFEAMPDLEDACEHLGALVAAEKRRDDKIDLRDLRVDSLGALIAPQRGDVIPGVPRLEMMERAWSQLTARAPRHVPASLRGNVNQWLRESNGTAVARTMESASGKAQECFALVSERYQPHDADQVASELARAMSGNDLKGRVKYMGSGSRYEIEAVLARPFDVDGDIHRVIVGVRSSDDGTMSQQITFKAWRLKCLNGMFIADSHLLRRVWHKGNVNRLREQFADGLAMAREAIESFSNHWRRAQRDRFVDAATGTDLVGMEALRRLVGTGGIVVPNIKAADLLAKFSVAWEAEPGDSVSDVLNAVTRAAHTATWRNSWTTENLEAVAGTLLYGQSYALAPLTAKQSEALAA